MRGCSVCRGPGSGFIKQDQGLSLNPDKFQIALKSVILQLLAWNFVTSAGADARYLSQNFKHVAAILQILVQFEISQD